MHFIKFSLFLVFTQSQQSQETIDIAAILVSQRNNQNSFFKSTPTWPLGRPVIQ